MQTATIIDADSLLLVNFSMDYLALYITGRMTGGRLRPLHMAGAASLGAGFALAVAVYDSALTGVAFRLLEAAATVLMAIAMSVTAGNSVRSAIVFIAVNMGLGGIMTAACTFLGQGTGIRSEPLTPNASPLLFAFIAAASALVSLVYGHFRQKSRRHAEVCIRIDGQSFTLNMLVDSGNLLREPISGKAVIVAAAAKLPIAEDQLRRRLRLIPSHSLAGERLLTGFLPDAVECGGRELDAVVALDTQNDAFDGCGGIIPAGLLI